MLFSSALAAQTPEALTIDQALAEALAGNLDVAAARYGVSVAEARQVTASLHPNPVLTVATTHLDLLGTGYRGDNNAGPNEFSAHTDFIFERGQKREARMELAAAERTLAQLSFDDALRRLVLDVESAFVDALAARDALALAEDNLRSLNSVVEVNRARVGSGDLAVVELNRSRVAAAQLQTAVRQAQLQRAQAKRKLQLLLGRAGEFEISGELRRDVGPVDVNAIRETALLQRPDLALIRQQQARNRADLRLQLAQGKVDFTIGTEYTRQDAPGGHGNSVGLTFSTPLPVFNRNQGEVARSGQEIAQAGALVKALEARIANEAAVAWEQYASSGQLVTEIEKDLLTRAREVRSTMEYSYRRGEATLVEFLDSQRAFNDTVLSYNTARADYARSLYLIDSVMARRR